MRFPLLTLRILWQSALLLLVPGLIGLVVVVPLALVTKSALVEVQVITNDVDFTLLAGSESGQEVNLLQSVRAQQVTVTANSVRVPVAELIEKDQNRTVLRGGSVEFRAERRTSVCEVEFEADKGELSLQDVRSRAGSQVHLYRKDDEVRIDITPRELVEGRILLPDRVSLAATGCSVLNADGSAVPGLPESPQRRFILQPGASSVEIASPVKTTLRAQLSSNEDQELPGAFSEFLRIADLTFSPGPYGTLIPVRQGVVRFRTLDKKDLEFENGFLNVPQQDTFDLVAMSGKAGALDLTLSGIASSLKVGKTPHPAPEELPDLLEWLYHQQQLGLIAGALVWISGTVLAAVNLLDKLKKPAGHDFRAN